MIVQSARIAFCRMHLIPVLTSGAPQNKFHLIPIPRTLQTYPVYTTNITLSGAVAVRL